MSLYTSSIKKFSSLAEAGIQQGIALLYDFDINAANNALVLIVKNVQTNPRLKSLSEGRLAGHAFLNQGSDLIIGQGTYSALRATEQNQGLVAFGVGQGGTSQYDTGSHINVDGFSMLTGGTGIGELGLAVKPVQDSGFSFDLGVQGYTGVREGVTGSMQLKFEF